MRTVPFRIVVLLGMDDGAFPKVEIRKQWDPMLKLRKGELDKQQIDRHLFLEALLSTRDQFWVLWSGRNVHSGDETPPCTPVNELIQVLQENTPSHPVEVSEFPLQPWTLKNFLQFNFGPQYTEDLLDVEPNLSTFSDHSKRTPSEHKKNVSVYTITEMTRVILQPYRFFFNKAMNIRLPFEEKEGQIREPLSLDGLESWSIKSKMLNGHLTSSLQETVLKTDFESHFRLLGDLPLGGAGVLKLETLSDSIVPTVDLINQYSHKLLDPLKLRCSLSNGDVLVSTVSRVYETDRGLILQWVSPSKAPSKRLYLESWLSLMMALQAGHTVLCAEMVCMYKSKVSSHRLMGTKLDSDFAKEYLESIFGILEESTLRFLPIFTNTSFAIAKELSSNEDFMLNRTQIPTNNLRPIIHKEWDYIDSDEGLSDKDWEDAYLQYFCFGYSPLDNFSNQIDENECVSWALKIWQPIFESANDGQKTLAIIDEES